MKMKKPTMTYSEFVELAKRHNGSDSISERKEIEAKVDLNAKVVLDRVDGIYTKIGPKGFAPTGEYALKLEDNGELDGRFVKLTFDDYQIVGDDDEDEVIRNRTINVDMKLLDDAELDAYANEVVADKIQRYEDEIARLKDEIKTSNEMIDKLNSLIDEKKRDFVGKGWRDIVGYKDEAVDVVDAKSKGESEVDENGAKED